MTDVSFLTEKLGMRRKNKGISLIGASKYCFKRRMFLSMKNIYFYIILFLKFLLDVTPHA